MTDPNRQKARQFAKEVSEWNNVRRVSAIIGIPPAFETVFPAGISSKDIEEIRQNGFDIDMVTRDPDGISVWIKLQDRKTADGS